MTKIFIATNTTELMQQKFDLSQVYLTLDY